MTVKYAEGQDWEFVRSMDAHATERAYRNLVDAREGYLLWEQGKPVGWMYYVVLWGRVPFLNLIIVREESRGRGFASQALSFWEDEMRSRGYPMVLLSTQADEGAQHLYRRLGYQDCGGLLFHGTPLEQPTELFFRKVL